MRSVGCSGLAILAVLGPGCGGADGARERALEATRLAAAALDEIDLTVGGEQDPSLGQARERSRRWLEATEDAVQSWSPGRPSIAYETAAPCLADALGELRDALVHAGRPVPENLEMAEAMAHEAAEQPCAERRARPRGEGASDGASAPPATADPAAGTGASATSASQPTEGASPRPDAPR